MGHYPLPMTAPGPAAPPPYPVPPGVPAPPPGPGVSPPFAAPPTEGRSKRLWWGLGVGAFAIVLCCGAGGAAVIGLAVTGTQAVDEQARVVTGDYYQALVDEQYGEAYDLLCDAVQNRESRPEFERRVAAEPDISSYRVGGVNINDLTVPVDVTFSGGSRDTQQVNLAQDRQTGTLEVCGVS